MYETRGYFLKMAVYFNIIQKGVALTEVRTTKYQPKKVDGIDMTSKEMKSIKKIIDSKFAEKLKKILIEDQEYFALDDGIVICVALIVSYEAVLIEYADSIEAARKNCFEDGDLFYLDAADADTIYQAMLREMYAKDIQKAEDASLS